MEETGYVGENLVNVLQSVNTRLTKAEDEEFAFIKEDRLRVEYLLKKEYIHDELAVQPRHALKSANKAKDFRDKGNQLFQKKEYKASIEAYTESILHAPTPYTLQDSLDENTEQDDASVLLSLAFANRSAALFHIQKYDLCIKDIDQAIANRYPPEMLYKVYDRKGKCHLKLKNKARALENFRLALSCLPDAKLDEKRETVWKQSLAKQSKLSETLIDDTSFRVDGKVASAVAEVKDANAQYPRITSKAEVKMSDSVGRHLKARANITVGSLLVSERPYECVLLEDFYDKHCYHCLNAVQAGLPDHQCSNILYCSEACRSQAWKSYHSVEYKILSLLGKDWCGNIGHLVFRIVSRAGLKFLLEFLEENKDNGQKQSKAILTGDEVYPDTFASIFHLATNIEQRVPDGLSDFAVFAIYLTKLLKLTGFFGDSDVDTDSKSILGPIGGLVLTLIQIIQVNSKGVIELQYPTDFEDPMPRDIGMGIYPTTALINHSCEPSAVAVFHGCNVVVTATRNIKAGQEISIDYGMVFYRNVLSQRQNHLGLRYSFQCKCPACVNNWPLWRDLHENFPTWKCEECEAGLNSIRTISGSLVRCDRCHHSQDLKECMKKLGTSHDLFSRAMEEAVAGNIKFALDGIKTHLSLCQKFLSPPWKDLIAAQAAIRQCLRLEGNIRVI